MSNNTGSTIWEAAKQEWTKHICNLLVPIVEEGFRTIYANCERSLMPRRPVAAAAPEDGAQEEQQSEEEEMPAPDQVGVMSAFQQTLKNIPKWNLDIVDQEYARILKQLELEDCSDVLDDLVKAAFTSHILILTSVNLSGKANKKVEMNIPSSKRFIHKIYIESARVFFRNPHLFVKSFESVESEYRYHKNSSRIEAIICGSVEEAIRKLMPIKTILKAYLNAAPEEEANDEVLDEVEDITRRVSPRSKRGLRGILKSYIETTSEVIKQPGTAETTPPKSILKPQKRKEEDDDDQDDQSVTNEESPEKEPYEEEPRDQDSEEEDDRHHEYDRDEEYEHSEDDITIKYSGGSSSNRRESLMDRRVSPERSDRMMKKPVDIVDDKRGRRVFDREHRREHDRDQRRPPYEEEDKEPEIHIERKPRDRQKSIEFRLEKDDEEVDNTKKRVAYKAPQKSHMAFFPDVDDEGDVIDEEATPVSPEASEEDELSPPPKHRSDRRESRPDERRESRPDERRESRPVEKRESRPVEKRESRPVEKRESRSARESRPVEKRDRRPLQVEKRDEKRDRKSNKRVVIDPKKRK
jgi:hypothetical protein